MYSLYLDDIRFPKTQAPCGEWGIVRSYEEAIWHVLNCGIPSYISFDHDLGETEAKTGYDFAKWLCSYCLEQKSACPDWNVHSANPVGAKNIDCYMRNFSEHNPYM